MIAKIHNINECNVLWVNDNIKGKHNYVDMEVLLNVDISEGDLIMNKKGEMLYVKQAKFDRFTNMPACKMSGQVIRITSVANEKTII